MGYFAAYMDWFLIGGGLLGLFLGGEALIRGAVTIAERLRLPKLLVGLTIVGFGTSMPELLVSLKAVSKGAADVAVGNVIGSNIANILLIAGMGALISPFIIRGNGVKRDALVMTLATTALAWFAWQGGIDRRVGLALTATLCLYLVAVLIMDRNHSPAEEETSKPIPFFLALIFVGVGLLSLVFGADSLVRGATSIATQMGVSQAVIGLTLVAVGTSLPELTVSVISAFRRQNEMALGNVIGSNIFNILAVLGITAVITPVHIDETFLQVDIPVLLAATAGLLLIVVLRPKLGRLIALSGLAIYATYMAWLALGPNLWGFVLEIADKF